MKLRKLLGTLLLATAGCTSPGTGVLPSDPSVYLPLEPATAWTWEVRVGDAALEMDAQAQAGDRRSLVGVGPVDSAFVLGRNEGTGDDLAKSAYLLPPDGPRELCFDGLLFRLTHEPPVVLLPDRVVAGAEWVWGGEVGCGDQQGSTFAHLRVIGEEEVVVPAGAYRAIRVRASYARPHLEVTRWFAPGVGLVRMDIDGAANPVRVRLLEHRPPLPR